MNYACHADVVCLNYAISADYPGAATRKVEEAFGNDLNCLFVQGAGGNIESLIISSRRTGPDDPFQTDYSTIERVGRLLANETVKLARTLSPAARKETTIRYLNDSLKFSGRFDKDATFDVHFSTILINDDIVIATFPGEPFIQLQLDWKQKVDAAARVLVRIYVAPGHLAELRAGHQVGGPGRLRGGPVEPQDDRGRLR